MEADFITVREDVSENLSAINIHIDEAEFREIMLIYWEKISQANERLIKEVAANASTVMDSTQAFVSKYVPPSEAPQRMTFE